MQTQRFISPKESSQWAIRLLIVMIAVYAIAIVLEWSEISLISRALNGEPVTRGELRTAESHLHTLFLATICIHLVTAAVFLSWFSRAYRNLTPLGARELRYSPGWAVGAWFVPFLNLVRPVEIARDIWRASDPRAARDLGDGWRAAPVPGLFAFWWIALLGSGILGRVAGLLARHASTAEALRSARWLAIVTSMVGIAAAWAAVRVIRSTTERQEERAALLTTRPLTG